MSYPTYTNTLANGVTGNATHVSTNFTDILNGVTDGTKDLNIAGIRTNGTSTLEAILPGTTNTHDFGSDTYKWKDLYQAGVCKGDRTLYILGAVIDSSAYATATNASFYLGVGDYLYTTAAASEHGIAMPRAGSVVSMSVNWAITTYSAVGGAVLSSTVTLNRSSDASQLLSLSKTLTAAGEYVNSTTQVRGTDTFSAGEYLYVTVSRAKFGGTSAYYIGHVSVIIDVVTDT